ncbi:MAG TPA: hypothetical protein VEI82_12025 [Myxococcota bacterium]|nr:hypothetical protein [Myxococcota bacterium]
MAIARRRPLVWLAAALACGCLLLWLTPALALRFALPALAARAGGAAEPSGVWPALPFGASAAHLYLARDARELALDDLRAVLLPSGPRLDARVAGGTLLVRGDDLFGRSGFVRIQGVALEALSTALATPLALRGRADGVWRFGASSSVEGSVTRGALQLSAPAPFELPFAELVVSAARDDATRDWDVRWVDLQGVQLAGSAQGRIGADGTLALRAQIRQLEEPVKSFFALMQLPTGPLPVEIALEGTLAQPRLAATAPLAGR